MAQKRVPLSMTQFHAELIGATKNYRNHGIDENELILETINSFDVLIDKVYNAKQGKWCLKCDNAKCVCVGNYTR